nr:hypothetical protein [Salinibacter sp.]
MVLKETILALWLLTYLGGVGTRSRRLAGSFCVERVDCPDLLTVPSFTPEAPLEESMEACLDRILPETDRQTPTDIDHLGRASVWVGENCYTSCSRAVDEIGASYKEYRDQLTDGQKIGFGLPIAQGDDGADVQRSGNAVERRASPLWMQIVEDRGGEYRPVFTLFGGNFLRKSEDVRVGGQPFEQVFRPATREFIERRGATLVYSP